MDSSNVNPIPEDVLVGILGRLQGEDLKSTRLVCQDWERMVNPLLGEKTKIVFDGDVKAGTGSKELSIPEKALPKFLLKSRTRSKVLIKHLEKSKVKFSLWDAMCLRRVSTSQVLHMLEFKTIEKFSISNLSQFFVTVNKLEISNSKIDVLPLMEFLAHFNNVSKFADDQSMYYSPTLFSSLCQSLGQLEGIMSSKFECVCFPFKRISIKQIDMDANSRVLLHMLDLTCLELEEFELEMQSNKNFQTTSRRSEFNHRLGRFLQRHSPSLKKLAIKWYNHEYDMYFDDCLQVLRKMAMSSTELALEELDLDFQWVFLWGQDVPVVLIPFIKKLKHLKKFKFQKVILQGMETLRTLQAMVPLTSGIEFELGAWVCEAPRTEPHFIFENNGEHRRALQSDFILKNLTNLLVSFDTVVVLSLQSIIPLFPVQKFENVKEFTISCRKFDQFAFVGPIRDTLFYTFNIDAMVRTFPNLTTLRIFDGPPNTNYSGFSVMAQYDTMSHATFGDRDIQSIISELVLLKSIRIRARMTLLTDVGLTGLSYDACVRMKELKSFKVKDDRDFIGLRLSGLKYLEEFSLRGLAVDVTDITACVAFKDCAKLKELNLFGTPMFTKQGREELRKFCKSKRIELAMTSA